jgi:hypothetical protein
MIVSTGKGAAKCSIDYPRLKIEMIPDFNTLYMEHRLFSANPTGSLFRFRFRLIVHTCCVCGGGKNEIHDPKKIQGGRESFAKAILRG